MPVLTYLKATKEVLPDYLVLIKIGSFYHAYGRDSYILSYLFGYKLKPFDVNNVTCGFPVSSLSKIMSELEDKKINYVCLDRRNNYEEDNKMDFRNLNNYEKAYKKARVYVNSKRRIEEIYNALIEDIFQDDIKEKISKIEEIVYEGRKI